MKRKKTIILGTFIIIIFSLVLTNPRELDYSKWLEREHEINCSNDEQEWKCRKSDNNNVIELKWKSRHIQHIGIYSIYEDYYEDREGRETKIKAIGILKTFINL
ncbi:hypothetical protein [Paenibacillus sp. CMAA1364]